MTNSALALAAPAAGALRRHPLVERSGPVVTIVLALIAIWYVGAVLMNLALVRDGFEREETPYTVSDLIAGTIDVGLVWGPIAGYFVKKKAAPLELVLLEERPDSGERFTFEISMGVRKGDKQLKEQLEGALARRHDEIEHVLSEAARPFRINRGSVRQLTNVGAGNERFVAGSRQDDATHRRVVLRVLESGSHVLPCRRIQGVEHLGPIDRYVGDRTLFLVQDVRERKCCRRRSCGNHVGIPVQNWGDRRRRRRGYTKAPMPVMALPTIRFCI